VFEKTPISARKTQMAECVFGTNGEYDGVTTSNILSRLQIELDLVSIIPEVPCYLQTFDDESCSPSFASVAAAKPKEVGFLDASPFHRNIPFKKG
jgi:hypothetical protein